MAAPSHQVEEQASSAPQLKRNMHSMWEESQQEQASSPPKFKQNMFSMWEVPSSAVVSPSSSACSYSSSFYSTDDTINPNRRPPNGHPTIMDFEKKEITTTNPNPNPISLLTANLQDPNTNNSRTVTKPVGTLSQYLETGPKPPTPPRASGRLNGRPQPSKPVDIPAKSTSTRKVSFRLPTMPSKEDEDEEKRPAGAAAAHKRFCYTGENHRHPFDVSNPWECCLCTGVNSEYEFHCSMCRKHKKCEECEDLGGRGYCGMK